MKKASIKQVHGCLFFFFFNIRVFKKFSLNPDLLSVIYFLPFIQFRVQGDPIIGQEVGYTLEYIADQQ